MKVLIYNCLLVAFTFSNIFFIRRRIRRKILPGIISVTCMIAISISGAVIFFPGNYFGMLQLLSWAIFVQLPLLLISLALLYYRNNRKASMLSLCVSISIVLIGIQAFFIEPYNLQITEYKISSQKIRKPLRIAIISDIQTDNPGAFEEKVLRKLMNEQPDIILFSGDYIQISDSRSHDLAQIKLNSILRKAGINAPMGVYAVQGNVDWSRIWHKIFQGLPVRILGKTQSYDLGPLILTGLSLSDSFNPGLKINTSSKFHIVFGHGPDFSMGKIKADLLIAGHTHGGQVQLPFIGPLITLSIIPRAWADGLTKLGSEQYLIVSKGIGMERGKGPRLRFLCPPEIVIVDLSPVP